MLSLIIRFVSLGHHRLLFDLLELSIDLLLPLDTDRSRYDECIVHRHIIVAVTEADSPLSIYDSHICSAFTTRRVLLFLRFIELRDSFLEVLEGEGSGKGRVF